MAQSFSTNTGLSALPEYDQSKDPAAYAELLRIRNAIQVLQAAIDGLGGAGGVVVTHSTGNLQSGRVIVAANNAGDITNIADGAAAAGNILSWVAAGTPPIWIAPTTAPIVPISVYAEGSKGGDYSTTSAVYANIGTITASIPATIGDVLELQFNGMFYGFNGQNVHVRFTTNGNAGSPEQWFTGTGAILYAGHRCRHVVVSGDISAGVVPVAIQWSVDGGVSAGISNVLSSPAPLWPTLTVTNWKH